LPFDPSPVDGIDVRHRRPDTVDRIGFDRPGFDVDPSPVDGIDVRHRRPDTVDRIGFDRPGFDVDRLGADDVRAAYIGASRCAVSAIR
jgi:hypothetical protein